MMRNNPLFRVSSLVQEERDTFETSVVDDDGDQDFLLCKGSLKIHELFPSLKKNTTIHYVSNGEWSTHELIIHLLGLIGPADLYFTTWSLKEYPVRLFLDAMEDGRIKRLCALLDSRVKVRNPDVLMLAQQNFSMIRQYDCHAKVTVLMSDQWTVSIVGSANMTNNPRLEAGLISTLPAVGHFHSSWILDLIKKGHPLD
jgi:hypothetical protein